VDDKTIVVNIPPADCIKKLENAVNILKTHGGEIRTHRLYGLLAECYLKNKSMEKEKREIDNQKALYYARKAVEMNPFSTEDRGLLSRVYFKLNDYDQANINIALCFIPGLYIFLPVFLLFFSIHHAEKPQRYHMPGAGFNAVFHDILFL
jgi:hypothetical protein